MEERWRPKMHLRPLCSSLLLKPGALVGGESESLILLPDSTESSDNSNTKAGRMLAIVTGSILGLLWGCFLGFFKVL